MLRGLRRGSSRSYAFFVRPLAAFTTDLGHVLAIATHCFATFATGGASLFGAKLVSGALLVGRMTAFAGDLTLLRLVHGGEAAVALPGRLIHIGLAAAGIGHRPL